MTINRMFLKKRHLFISFPFKTHKINESNCYFSPFPVEIYVTIVSDSLKLRNVEKYNGEVQ